MMLPRAQLAVAVKQGSLEAIEANVAGRIPVRAYPPKSPRRFVARWSALVTRDDQARGHRHGIDRLRAEPSYPNHLVDAEHSRRLTRRVPGWANRLPASTGVEDRAPLVRRATLGFGLKKRAPRPASFSPQVDPFDGNR